MKSIVAVDRNWGIGKDNKLLFDIKADMRSFVEHTKGKIVVMGSNTLLSLPNSAPLKNRVNIVLWPDGSRDDVILAQSLEELLELLGGYDSDDIYVIGGAMMYHTLLPYCDEAIVTKVDADGSATVFYDNLDQTDGWKLVSESQTVEDSGYRMRFCVYRNLRPKGLSEAYERKL